MSEKTTERYGRSGQSQENIATVYANVAEQPKILTYITKMI